MTVSENKQPSFLQKNLKWLIVAILVSLVLIVAIEQSGIPPKEGAVPAANNTTISKLVTDLNKAGWVMFGTSDCPMCAKQMGILGNQKELYYINCLENNQTKEICRYYNITAVPTWLNINTNETVVGVQNLSQLQKLADIVPVNATSGK